MSPYDLRQLRRMLLCIRALRERTVSLTAGVGTLMFLRGALETSEEAWNSSFGSYVLTLELASLESRAEITAMGANYDPVISQALDELEALVLARAPNVDSPDEEDEEA